MVSEGNVSVKLILMAYKSSITAKNLEKGLAEIQTAIERLESGRGAGGVSSP